MDTYERESIGNIVIIKNLIFEDSRTEKKILDYAWSAGRPCVIIYSDDEYDYILPLQTNVKNETYKDYYYILEETSYLHKQVNIYGKYNSKRKRQRKTKGVINLNIMYKIPISGHDETGKITFETYKKIIEKLKIIYNKENINEITEKAQTIRGR